jgi:GH24 family phage-related lysozyme (muramidase)
MKNVNEFKKHLANFEGRGKVGGTPGLMYLDHKDIPTVGVGFNLKRKDADDCLRYCGVKENELNDVKKGKLALTETQMMSLLEFNVAEAEKIVRNKIGTDTFEALHEKQQWALVSLTFNSPSLIGPNLKKYTSSEATSSDQENAYVEILLKSNKHNHHGLQNRREVEAAWYLEGVNASRQEHQLKPIDEHPLAHQNKNNHTPHRKVADQQNHTPHAQQKNWHAVAKGKDSQHDHTNIDRLMERIEKTLHGIKEAITQENHQKATNNRPVENHADNERRHSPSPR